MTVIEDDGHGDALAPLRIGHADHYALGNSGMFAQCFLNLQGGYLVTARLEYVNVRSAKNAIDALLDDRRITGAKPTVPKDLACCVGPAPVFCEHARTTDFDLAGCSWRNEFAVLSDKLNLDARQRRADAARHARAP